MTGLRGTEGWQGLECMVDSAAEAARLVRALRDTVWADATRLEAMLQAGERHQAILLIHRMLGALCLFQAVPGFARIQDVVDVMRASDPDRLAADWPRCSQRLLAFVDALEQDLGSGPT